MDLSTRSPVVLFVKECRRLVLSSSAKPHCEEKVADLCRLVDRTRHTFTFNFRNAIDLAALLAKYPEFFRSFELRGDIPCVAPTTEVTVCATHSSRGGSCTTPDCRALHFCVFFLLSGSCRYGDRCLFGHNLGRDPHNREVLEQHLLDGLTLTELRRLFCLPWVRRGVTVPRVCRYYNVHRGCSKGGNCHSLHLCDHYVAGQCKFAKGCKRNHDINHQQVTQVLSLYGVAVTGRPLRDILAEVRDFPREEQGQGDSGYSDDDAEEEGVYNEGWLAYGHSAEEPEVVGFETPVIQRREC